MAEDLQQMHQQSYPDMPFADFVQRVHQQHYSDMPFDDFARRAGLRTETQTMQDRVGDAFVGNEPAVRGDRQLGVAIDQRRQAAETRPAPGVFGRMLIDFENQGLAGGQRVSPDTTRYGAPISTDVLTSEENGQRVFTDPATGQLTPINSERHVALLDPRTGRLGVYQRNPDVEEGRIGGIARIFSQGLVTAPASSQFPAVASQTARAAVPPVVQAAERLGVDLPRAVASDSIAVQQMGNVARNVPWAGRPLVEGTERAAQQVSGAADDVARGLGASDPARAGGAVRGTVARVVGEGERHAADSIEGVAGALGATNQARAGSAIRGTLQQATEQAGQRVTGSVDDVARELGATSQARAGTNARSSLADWAGPVSEARVTRAYDAVDAAIDPAIRSGLFRTMAEVSTISSANRRSGLEVGRPVQYVAEAISQARSYAEIKNLRTHVGELMRRAPEGTSLKEWRRLYGALSEDLGSAAQAAGGQAGEHLWRRANTLNRATEGRREALQGLLGARSDEEVFRTLMGAATTGGRADVELLNRARRAMGPEQWRETAGTIVRQLGTSPAGEFGAATFAANWGRMSEQGRTLLFGANAPNNAQRRALEGIARSHQGVEAQRQALHGLLGAGSDEQAFRALAGAATAGGRANIDLLNRARQGLGQTQWDEVAGTVARQIATNPAGETSAATFASFGGRLSPSGGCLLFGAGTPQRRAFDSMASGHQAVQARREALQGLLGTRSDEQVFRTLMGAATDGGRANMELLTRARRVVGNEQWNEVAGTVVQQMGYGRSGEFSLATFGTNWRNMSDGGRNLLFGMNTPHRRALEDIATVATKATQFERFGNPSGTARGAIGASAGWGLLTNPVETLTGLVSARMLSNWLAKPVTAQATSRWLHAFDAASHSRAPAAINSLSQASQQLAGSSGGQITAQQLLQLLQSPGRTRAEENQVERPVGR